MKKLISLYTSAVLSKSVFYNIFAISVFLFLMSSCAKDVPDQEHNVTSDQISTSIPKSEIPNNYIDGETVPEILAEVDKANKPAELEHRTSDKLPFKVLGYDKSRALKVYNDSFEITSYAFLAYTDLTDFNKVVNIVVTQKKNGKPGKPYLYEYTYKPVQNRPQPLLTRIVKYKFKGVKVDLPGANFDPCVGIVCDGWDYQVANGGGSSGSGSSGGGGTQPGGGSSGGSGGSVQCFTSISSSISGNIRTNVYFTQCTDGSAYTLINYTYIMAIDGCCDTENVTIGVVGGTYNIQHCSDILDSIKIHSSFSNCAVLNCIYNKLYNNGSPTFCKNIFRFNNSKLNLNIFVGPVYHNADGMVEMSRSGTNPNPNGTGVNMTFHTYNCSNSDHIEVAETILHESIHAKFRFELGVKNTTTKEQYQYLWTKWVKENYGYTYNEDQIIVLEFMKSQANELWLLNNKKFDPSYYMAWVWDGLAYHWSNKFSTSQVNEWNSKRNTVKSNNPFKCN